MTKNETDETILAADESGKVPQKTTIPSEFHTNDSGPHTPVTDARVDPSVTADQ